MRHLVARAALVTQVRARLRLREFKSIESPGISERVGCAHIDDFAVAGGLDCLNQVLLCLQSRRLLRLVSLRKAHAFR